MKIEEINRQIEYYKTELEKLQPTLRPGKSIPFSKIGILNVARRKEQKYKSNIMFLNVLKNEPDKLSDELIKEVLK